MNKKELAAKAVELLKKEYPDAICSLEYEKPHELLFATRLAAQCTDVRVNMVTPVLYSKYPTLEALANADEQDISDIIRSCGFYKTKAHDISLASKMLVNEYGGVVPDTVEELIKLPGIGRKTANLVVGDVYGKPAVVCDTHCIRITNLLGFTDTKDPAKCEIQLREILDPKESNNFCHRMVLHGRAVCIARRPQCDKCVLKEICEHAQKTAE
ncbi:MAG: endonuclease III [Oscillospiraceae bacterium]|nr:endonuclease III [Oscillospiraceae bacterium]